VGILARSSELSSCNAEDPCVIGGDFNDWRSLLHPIFTEILGFDCATQKPIGYDVGIRTYPSFSPQGGLDRIYFRGPITKVGARGCRMRVSRVASDHLPVIVDLDLTG
jgi:endonuclease/exonuclease/phosphatase family metal-dependent hydrolase